MKATRMELEQGDAAAGPTVPAERLVSLDALRGFDMLWITGGTAILLGLGKVLQRPWFDQFLEQFEHVPWRGLHLFDLIWPLFMFVMGAAIPLSVAKRRASGAADRSLLLHAVRRALIMFALERLRRETSCCLISQNSAPATVSCTDWPPATCLRRS